MILVKLMGGLGNQMFQYAAARSLAEKHHTSLKLDTSFLEKRNLNNQYTFRNYELGIFPISSSLASLKEIRKFTVKPHSLMGKIIRFLKFSDKTYYFKEKNFSYHADFLDHPDNTYLDGFWQSEKYFLDIESIIREEFKFKYPLSDLSQELRVRMQNCNSVAIHIRRGDYITNPETSNYHGTCSIDFYHLAVLSIAKRVNQPEFFIFSDDPAWVKSNLKLNYPTVYIEHNSGDKSFEDMHLMSLCKHQIIANSSFSWWGAWLNKNQEKVVVAPRKWFNSTDIDTSDLIPQNWIRI